MTTPKDWIEITDVLTPAGIETLDKNEVLSFVKDKVRHDYKIMLIQDGLVWVKEINTYTPEEAEIKANNDAKMNRDEQ